MIKKRFLLNYEKTCTHPPIAGSAALSLENVSFNYANSPHPILKEINLKIYPKEKVALIGPNGAGKSTLMKLIIGLEKIRQGTITIFGYPATSCRHRVAMVAQRSAIDYQFPITAREVVAMGRYVHLGWFKRLSKFDYEIIDFAMEKMLIKDLANRKIGELSGGQQQRVMLARTLAHDADLLLLDEPLNHVDLSTQELIFHTLEELCKLGKAVIISTHDLGILTVHFSRVVFLDKTIIADGLPDKILTAQNIAKAYGFEFHPEGKYGPVKLDN